MDSRAARLEDAAASDGGDGDDRRRVEELVRVNERLAAEVRSLALGRTEEPRSAAMTSARRIGTLIDERDALRETLARTEAELALANQHREELERHRLELAAELRRLRGGWRGLLRRARARLLLRR